MAFQVTYNTLLRARSRYGSVSEVQQCLAIYQDMRKSGYKPNDYYLEQLIEEWCEGVIQDSCPKQWEFNYSDKADIGRPGSLLLEKVAEHLQQNTDTLAVDLQGLTKVEARIVVLAVLRLIKENYTLGDPVKDDMLIMVGVQDEVDGGLTAQNSEVKSAITKLLQDELGLKVLSTVPNVAVDTTIVSQNTLESDQILEEKPLRKKLQQELIYSTRRPVLLERLKVSKKSLQQWLRRRSSPGGRGD